MNKEDTRTRLGPGFLHVSTFSVVARDPKMELLGVGVASKFLGVGAVVPWARASVGAVATQSYVNTTFGPRALEMLATGSSAEGALQTFRATDKEIDRRQVGIVDAGGRAVTFTGGGCHPWAGGEAGQDFAAQGNLLAGPQVVDAMIDASRAVQICRFPSDWALCFWRGIVRAEIGEAASPQRCWWSAKGEATVDSTTGGLISASMITPTLCPNSCACSNSIGCTSIDPLRRPTG